MAITSAKVTYSLKPETVGKIERLALKWGVPKSEAVQRAVLQVAAEEHLEEKRTPLQALAWLQKNGISPAAAAKFNKEVRDARRASSLRRG